MTSKFLTWKALSMTQQEENASNTTTEEQNVPTSKRVGITKKVTDHLANERTFLAWVRTGLATIAFGFVVERFGLLVRELGLKTGITNILPVHYSSFFGVSLTILGVAIMIVALLEFLHIRRSIDLERFHPPAGFAIVLTVLVSLIGTLLAIYLILTA
jgi:putative membrane protein